MSLSRLVDPASIAIAGLSADAAKHGARVLANLRRLGYPGRVWGVNPRRPEIEGVDVHATIGGLPEPPDLVVAAVPGNVARDVVADSNGVGGVILFASGFAETGPVGRNMQDDLAALAVSRGTRLLGPNSGGIIRPDRGLAASFLTCLDRPRDEIKSGPVAVVTQSGGIGSHLHNLAAARDEGIAISVSTGNEADIEMGEAIDAVSRLDGVEVVLAVIETVRNGLTFRRAVEACHSRGKRVVVCPIGAGATGGRLMTSHTGALAVPHAVMRGVLETLGVVVAETPAEAYDIAMVLARSSHPPGRRVAIVTHSGGVAILLADLADRAGLALDDPSPRLKAVIRQSLDHGSPTNPVDMGGIIGGPTRFAEVVGEFGRSGEYDAVLAVTTPHPPAHTIARVESLLDLRTDASLIHLWMAGDQGAEGLAALRDRGIAVTEEPRAAIRALAGLLTPPPPTRFPDPIVGPPESWGVPLIGGRRALTSAEAVLAAESLGYPVVVKLEAGGLDHKTESGGVFLDLRNDVEVEHAAESVMSVAAALGLTDTAMRVQRFRPGLEVVVGALHHHSFGPVVSIGFGGVLAEVVEDVAFAPAPVTTETAHAMIDRLRARRLLDGYRGAPPADVGELGRIVSLVSRGIAGHSVQEFEINPLIWDGIEWLAVDVLVV